MAKETFSKQLFQIRKHCTHKSFRYTQHFTQRLLQRRITIDEVETAIANGNIIEDYPDDYPYPSCLLLGYTINKQPLHVVCAITIDELFLITAYRPNPAMWSADFTTRTTQRKE